MAFALPRVTRKEPDVKVHECRWVSLALATCLVAIALSLLLDQPTSADPSHPGTLFASATGAGTACTQSSPCSLQTALTEAGDGDALCVAGGVYTGTGSTAFHIHESITLRGGWNGAASGPVVSDPVAYPTILDGESERRVVRIAGNISPTLDGFFVVNGRRSEGAGIAVYPYGYQDAAAIIRNCVIENNVATGGWGGGIQVEGGRPLIEHSRIVSNTTRWEGGGIAIAWWSRPTLKDNLIAGNSAQVRGAGVRLRDTWTTLLNNTIAHNTGAGGDGVYASNTTLTVTNNIIVSNLYGLRTDGTLTATVSCNDVCGNATADFAGLSDPTGSNGNISLDPLFVSGPDGNYYLSQSEAGQGTHSPAVDAGSDLAVSLGLHNRTTRADGEPDSGVVDMGYHYRVVERVCLPLILRD